MSRQGGQGLRATLSSLRSALSQSGPSAGRLQLTVSTSPPPPPPLAAGHPAEAEALLLSPGRSGQVAAAAPSPPPTVHTTSSFPAAGVDAVGGGPPAGLGAMGSDGPAAGTQQASGEAADVAAAAEQHRLTNAAASVDLRSLAIALERGLPCELLGVVRPAGSCFGVLGLLRLIVAVVGCKAANAWTHPGQPVKL